VKKTIKKSASKKAKIEKVEYKSIVKSPFADGAITRDDFPGFKEDYMAIHSIIRKYQPQNLIEIGTSMGTGTNIICNAMNVRKGLIGRLLDKKKVTSIDVPPGTDPSIIYPEGEDGHPVSPGANCGFPFTQLFGSSIDFDFKPYYPVESWFIDGKHNYEYCSKDTKQALKSEPHLIIWHDMQIQEVYDAVADAMYGKGYTIQWVEKTRVAFAIKQK